VAFNLLPAICSAAAFGLMSLMPETHARSIAALETAAARD